MNAITPDELHRTKEWPESARSLSENMRRAAPGIRMVGIGVESRFLHGKTIWSLYKIGYGNHPTYPTQPTSEGGQGGQESLPNLTRSDDGESDEREAIENEPPLDPDNLPWSK